MKPAAAAAFALALAACAPTVVGGPPIVPPASLQNSSAVAAVTVSTGWMGAEDDFAESFAIEVREELRRCLRGPAPLDVHVELIRQDRVSGADRLSGNGLHALSGTVEFRDPAQGGAVVGRFPVATSVRGDGRFEGVIGDRQTMAAEAFGRATCEEAFGAD
jgi:hypothetical protein